MKPLIRFAFVPLLLVAACGNQQENSDSRASSSGIVPKATALDASPVQIQAAVGDSPAAEFYRRNGWQAVWSDQNTHALQQELSQRTKHGLDQVSFLPDISAATPADKEAALTNAALAYAAALAHGITDPTKLYDIYDISRPQPDLVAGLQQALTGGQLASWLDGLAPHDSEYTALSDAYAHYREQARTSPEQEIPAGGLIHPGESDPRIPAIRERLMRRGYLQVQAQAQAPVAPDETPADRYTSELADAVRSLQQDSGLKTDGVIGPNTFAELNLGPADRARALAVAMERRRWLVRNPPGTRIDVNTAAATLRYFRDGKFVDQRKVIDGRPDRETPQIQTTMFRLVANPTWTVPKSIQKTEMAHVSSDYLSRHNMVLRDGWIVQLSGPSNALGLVKFDLKDKYAIYLHDTPAKSLFDLDARQKSHGCVRVQDALGFADMLAEQQGITAQWQNARRKSGESFLPLPHEIPVRMLYHPTFVSVSGEVMFGRDVYGWNDAIAQRLGFNNHSARRISATGDGLGP